MLFNQEDLSKGDYHEIHDQNGCGYPYRLLFEYGAFLTEVLNLEIAHYDKEKEFVQLKLPSGEILEVLGSKSLWHPFTTTPDWEVTIADVRHLKEKIACGEEDTHVAGEDPKKSDETQGSSPNNRASKGMGTTT